MKLLFLVLFLVIFFSGCSCINQGICRDNYHESICEKNNMTHIEKTIIPKREHQCIDSNNEIHTFYVQNYSKVSK